MHNKGLQTNIIRVTKWRRWTGFVARMGERTNAYRLLVVNSEEKIHLEDFDIDGIAVREENRVRRGGGNYIITCMTGKSGRLL
jgi:hypothetical protein